MANKKFAGFFIRILAGIIDLIVLLPPLIIISLLFLLPELQKVNNTNILFFIKENENLINIISLIISLAYLTYFVSSNKQGSIGKIVLGIYIGNIDGSKLSKTRSLYRALMTIITSMTLGLGFLLVLFNKEKISLHDFICKTRVFYKNK